jgi:UDP-galactopyranose mutase
MSGFDWLVVGAGFTGATFAERLASVLGAKVLVIDRRPHLGGNAYDSRNSDGVLVHRYGPHIFHTKSQRVWKYLSDFTPWRNYRHQVQAKVEGLLVPLPFNLQSIDLLFTNRIADQLKGKLISTYGLGATIPILRLMETSDAQLLDLAYKIYDWIFLGYNQKQWGLRPEDLDRTVTGRVPISISYGSNYFSDRYQGVPLYGYENLFRSMLSHHNIAVELGLDFREIAPNWVGQNILYTGPLDELCDYQFGALPYRSMRFEHETLREEFSLPVATVNFPNLHDGPSTRVTEQKRITGQQISLTTLTREFPCVHRPGENEPFYPIPLPENRKSHDRYVREVQQRYPQMLLAGRLADYRYYNMDQSVSNALVRFEVLKRNVDPLAVLA